MTDTALTIAGSDSSSGAGIQQDIKTFISLGVYPLCAITFITAQNTMGIKKILPLPPNIVESQIQAVVEDFNINACKIGALYSGEIVRVVARNIVKLGNIPIVLDPIMKATSGVKLLEDDALKILVEDLIPKATLITPNIHEAEILANSKIKDVNDMVKAARAISENLKAKAVLIKGGHLKGEEFIIDILYYEGEIHYYKKPRIHLDREVHGSGCTFSAAITAYLAKGYSLTEAVSKAEEYMKQALQFKVRIGRGMYLLDTIRPLRINAEKLLVLENLHKAFKLLKDEARLVAKYVPEVGMQIAMCISPDLVKGIHDVAAFPGRIVRVSDYEIANVRPPRFGASRHLARAILTVIKYDPKIRACINVKYDPKILNVARKLGLKISFYDRRLEPPEIKRKEGATIPWGVREAIKKVRTVPDIIYHLGDIGKEPMILILGEDAISVVKKLLSILKLLESTPPKNPSSKKEYDQTNYDKNYGND